MHIYAKVGDDFYRLFSIREGHSHEVNNDYIKWSLVYDFVDQQKFAKEFTIHPDKIAIKSVGLGYDTLHNFGYRNPKRPLVQLMSQNVSDGFARRKAYNANGLKKNAAVIPFPDHHLRPYWIAAYFTTMDKESLQTLFQDEAIDVIHHFVGQFGNLVTYSNSSSQNGNS